MLKQKLQRNNKQKVAKKQPHAKQPKRKQQRARVVNQQRSITTASFAPRVNQSLVVDMNNSTTTKQPSFLSSGFSAPIPSLIKPKKSTFGLFNRLFSTATTTEQQKTTQEEGNVQSTSLSVEEQALEARSKFKTVVASMNEDQRMIVGALVAESKQLRDGLAQQAGLIEAQYHQNKILAKKLEEYEDEAEEEQRRMATMVDEHGKPRLASPFNDPQEVGEGNYQLGRQLGKDQTKPESETTDADNLLTDDITQDITKVLLEREHDPRVRTVLMRERKLRDSIKPMADILEKAAAEKRSWTKRDNQKNIALFALASLLTGQSLSLYLTDSIDQSTVDALVNHTNTMHTYLREAVEIIETSQTNHNIAPQQPAAAATEQYSQNTTRWATLKEKMRLYNMSLTQPKNTNSKVDIAPLLAESKTGIKK